MPNNYEIFANDQLAEDNQGIIGYGTPHTGKLSIAEIDSMRRMAEFQGIPVTQVIKGTNQKVNGLKIRLA